MIMILLNSLIRLGSAKHNGDIVVVVGKLWNHLKQLFEISSLEMTFQPYDHLL